MDELPFLCCNYRAISFKVCLHLKYVGVRAYRHDHMSWHCRLNKKLQLLLKIAKFNRLRSMTFILRKSYTFERACTRVYIYTAIGICIAFARRCGARTRIATRNHLQSIGTCTCKPSRYANCVLQSYNAISYCISGTFLGLY